MSDAVEAARKARAAWAAMVEPVYPELSRNGWALYDSLQDLLAEIERLTAPRTEAEVEAAAIALWRIDYGYLDSWADERERGRENYRRVARIALDAADKVRATNQEDGS